MEAVLLLLVFLEMLVTASGDVVNNFYVEQLLVVFGSSVAERK